MKPAPRLFHPAYPGTAAQPWISVAGRCWRRAAEFERRAWDRPGGSTRNEGTPEHRAAAFWARVARRAEWYAGLR